MALKIAKIGGEIPSIDSKNMKMGDFALHNWKFPLIFSEISFFL
jgi:hypothetical protein